MASEASDGRAHGTSASGTSMDTSMEPNFADSGTSGMTAAESCGASFRQARGYTTTGSTYYSEYSGVTFTPVTYLLACLWLYTKQSDSSSHGLSQSEGRRKRNLAGACAPVCVYVLGKIRC